jgi:hypothetical protein
LGGFEPGFVEGVASTLAISIVAGLLVAWLLNVFRSEPRLTWELLTNSSLEKLSIFQRYEEDGKIDEFGREEYARRLAELRDYRYLCVFRILNRGKKPAENIRVLLNEKPSHVDTWEKIGIELKELKDGVFEVSIGSLGSDGYATITLLGPIFSLQDIRVEHQGVVVPVERTLRQDRRARRNVLQSTIFFTVLGLISLAWPLFIIFSE